MSKYFSLFYRFGKPDFRDKTLLRKLPKKALGHLIQKLLGMGFRVEPGGLGVSVTNGFGDIPEGSAKPVVIGDDIANVLKEPGGTGVEHIQNLDKRFVSGAEPGNPVKALIVLNTELVILHDMVGGESFNDTY